MMEHLDLGSIVGTVAGGGGVAFIAKIYIKRTLTRFDNLIESIVNIEKELAGFTAKLEKIDKNEEIIRFHDRKIVALETRFGES